MYIDYWVYWFFSNHVSNILNLHSTVYSVKLIITSSKAKPVTERMVKAWNKKIKIPHKKSQHTTVNMKFHKFLSMEKVQH